MGAVPKGSPLPIRGVPPREDSCAILCDAAPTRLCNSVAARGIRTRALWRESKVVVCACVALGTEVGP